MNQEKKAIRQKISVEDLNTIIIDAIQDKKGIEIIKYDLRKLDDAPTDFFIICQGDSTVQVKAISDNIQRELMEKAGEYASHVEGTQNSTWVLMDYFYTVVHIFHKETRDFYQLDKLWSDSEITEYKNL